MTSCRPLSSLRATERVIRKYVLLTGLEASDAKPSLKQQIAGLGAPLIKRFTYKRPPPMRPTC